jgi:hypothetical protein
MSTWRCVGYSRDNEPDISKRLNSQKSITKKSEEQGKNEQYHEQVLKEEEQDKAKKQQEDDLDERRRKFDADLAQQRANQAAEKAKADAAKAPSIMPPVRSFASQFSTAELDADQQSFASSAESCKIIEGSRICRVHVSPLFEQFRGGCYNIAKYALKRQYAVLTGVNPMRFYTRYTDEVIDVVCFSNSPIEYEKKLRGFGAN